MDSAVAATMMARTHGLVCLHGTYGQRTANRERACFGALSHYLGAVDRRVMNLSYLGDLGGSSLTDPGLPVADADPGSSGIPATYVPFRNAHLLAMAVSWAEVLGAHQVVIGAVEEDSSGYPDCTRAFYAAFQEAVRLGTRPRSRIQLVMPVIGLRKAEIVRRGQELSTPFHLTWSCYRDEARACGRCASCVLRLRGFAAAGFPDPIQYAPDVEVPGDAPGGPPGADPGGGEAADADRSRRVATLTAYLARLRRS
jgi:7-cyano-7-deazaguanine synthase